VQTSGESPLELQKDKENAKSEQREVYQNEQNPLTQNSFVCIH
jgi:hypothetical protein